MAKKLETGKFQELTVKESQEVSGGLGVATTWIQLGGDIVAQSLKALQSFFSSLSAPQLSAGFAKLNQFISSFFSDLVNSLGQRGL